MGDEAADGGEDHVDAHLLRGLDVRDRGHALGVEHDHRADIARLDLRRSFRQVQDADIDRAGHQLGR